MVMKFELPSEAVEAIIAQELKWHYDHCKPNEKPPMFSYDPEEDEREVKKLRKAFKRVLGYYGVDV